MTATADRVPWDGGQAVKALKVVELAIGLRRVSPYHPPVQAEQARTMRFWAACDLTGLRAACLLAAEAVLKLPIDTFPPEVAPLGAPWSAATITDYKAAYEAVAAALGADRVAPTLPPGVLSDE